MRGTGRSARDWGGPEAVDPLSDAHSRKADIVIGPVLRQLPDPKRKSDLQPLGASSGPSDQWINSGFT
jgi:hypothetical protein